MSCAFRCRHTNYVMREALMLCASVFAMISLAGAGVESNTKFERLVLTPSFKSAEECRTAAEGGDVSAMLEMAWRLERGNGVEKDLAQTVLWLNKASERGSAEAQFQLGCRLSCGDGLEPNATMAVQNWSRAAEAGHISATYREV